MFKAGVTGTMIPRLCGNPDLDSHPSRPQFCHLSSGDDNSTYALWLLGRILGERRRHLQLGLWEMLALASVP